MNYVAFIPDESGLRLTVNCMLRSGLRCDCLSARTKTIGARIRPTHTTATAMKYTKPKFTFSYLLTINRKNERVE